MLRLRLLRILLPLLLAGVAGGLYLSWKPRSSIGGRATSARPAQDPSASQIWFVEYDRDRRSVAGNVEHLEEREGGELHLEGIRDLEIHREGRQPLIVNAERGDRTGEEGNRVWNFEDSVVFREGERGLVLRLPQLEIDEAAGEARSAGDIRLTGPGVQGHTDALVYGLRGQPAQLTRPFLDDERGGQVSAREGLLLDGTNDIELSGDVVVIQQGERLDAGRMRLRRGENEQIEWCRAGEGVWGSWPLERGRPVAIRAEDLEIEMDDSGETRRVWLSGDASVRREQQSLGGEQLELKRDGPTGGPWTLTAINHVVAQTVFAGEPGLVRADELTAELDATFTPLSATALGRVSFEGRDTRAEADRATYGAEGGQGRIELHAADRGKARLSYGRTRVAAVTIVTDTEGRHLVAEERVEAGLLPGPDDGAAGPATVHLFDEGQAIHFVSHRLESSGGGDELVFTGAVRGWQGERNLAAERLRLDQTSGEIEAEGEVTTRFPRVEGAAAAAEDDYVQIRADRLEYTERDSMAVYTGAVRMRLAEGWVDCERVEVALAAATSEVEEIRAFESVRLEFHRSASGELEAPITGEADRLIYRPAESLVRMIGDQTPSRVQRPGKGGGTTTGRVLAYRLDLGTIEVDSGEQGPASIKTAGR